MTDDDESLSFEGSAHGKSVCDSVTCEFNIWYIIGD